MNVGCFIGNRRACSKKEIKEALKTNPSVVSFDCTDMFGEFAGRAFFASELPQGQSCVLVGPDPFAKRDFYGTVMRKGGEIVIK